MSGKQMKRLRRAMQSNGTTVSDAGYETPGQRRQIKHTDKGVSVGMVTLPVTMVANSGRALYQKVKKDLKRDKQTLA